MALINAELETILAANPLYSHEKEGKKAKILCKFFNAFGRGTWYVTEARKEPNGDYTFFGLADVFEKELGYFTLFELQSLTFRGVPMVERDETFNGKTLADVMD